MGLIKQMKDMKATVAAAPEMIAQAQRLGANAQAMADQQQQAAAAAYTAPQAPATGTDFAPIAGVTIEKYAEISRGLAAVNYDQSRTLEVAAAHGVSAADWATAVEEWNGRMQTNPAVGQRFNALYTQG